MCYYQFKYAFWLLIPIFWMKSTLVSSAENGTSNRSSEMRFLIGPLRGYAHGVQGIVYAVDKSTFFVRKFYFDGNGPEAYFYVGNSSTPVPGGRILRYPATSRGVREKLKAHRGSSLLIRMPQNEPITSVRWLAVWCPRFAVNYGDVYIDPNMILPAPKTLPRLSKETDIFVRSGNITLLDEKTFYVPELFYDGYGEEAFFCVGNGSKPNAFGIKIPTDTGSIEPLRHYEGADIELELPRDVYMNDIEWFAIWSVRLGIALGYVNIPPNLNLPPAVGQTAVSPTWWYNKGGFGWVISSIVGNRMSNCREVIPNRLQVQWEAIPSINILHIRLVAAIRTEQYVAFGVSGKHGSDIAVAYYDETTGKFHADDYFITGANECDGVSGVCRDETLKGRNDVRLEHADRRHGVSTFLYSRPLDTGNQSTDIRIFPRYMTNVVAAIGILNAKCEPGPHYVSDKIAGDIEIDFGSLSDFTCREFGDDLEDTDRSSKIWEQSSIRGVSTFHVTIGPSGGSKGYSALTGHSSMGISWYINKKLIPELYVERGKTYTFVIEGGKNLESMIQYHPFYITDNSEGGFGQKSKKEQKNERVFAGVNYDSEDNSFPLAAGRYCEWIYKKSQHTLRDDNFDKFFQELELHCEQGEPAYLNWTVDAATPDLLYYQCYMHKYLGWKIHVQNASSTSEGDENFGVIVTRPCILTLVISVMIIFYL